jgi:hypothetical protein
MRQKLMTLFLCGIMVISAKAQGGMFENWSVGVNAGLYGLGIQGATSLSPNFKARVGFDYLKLSYNDGISFDAPIINAQNRDISLSGELSGAELKFPNFKAMVDFYPVKNGIFCITAGFYVGNNKITTNGKVDDYQNLMNEIGKHPEFDMEGTIIKPNNDGSFDANIKLGETFKPYVGLGLGRTIPNSRVGFKFELGVVYQGKISVDSDNVSDSGLAKVNDMASDFDLPVSKNVLKLWPMLNFTLSYRIK